MGMLISAVIHQPRYSVFILFDELLLLAKGGLTAYMGPTEQVRTSVGYAAEDVPDVLEGDRHVGDGGERGAALGLMAKHTEDVGEGRDQ